MLEDQEGTAICSECGGTFAADDLVSYGNALVCAGCKPMLVQKIKEGVSVSGMAYAGFWIRAGAKIIDWIILTVVNQAIALGVGFLLRSLIGAENMILLSVIPALLQLLINAAYTTFFLGKYAATPGKMACGLTVVTGENESVSYLRGFGRHFAEMLSGIVLCIGYLLVVFDDEKRSLHDRICDTRVIRK